MKAIQHAAAALLLGFASQATAASFGYCYVDFGGGADATRYVSGVIEVRDEAELLSPGGAFREAFLDHVRSRYESGASAVACDSWETLNDARRAAFEADIAGEVIRVRTSWLGGRREAGGARSGGPAKTAASTATPKTTAPKASGAKPQWEVEYEAKMAVYQQELARQKAAVAEYERAQAELQRSRAAKAGEAQKAVTEWERAVAACRAGDYSACSQAPE